jgi:hypothetical protein
VARQETDNELRDEARDLQTRARLEDITVRQNPITKKTKKGEKTYFRWVCSWQVGDKTITKYLGSCANMSETEALETARKMKMNALDARKDRGNKQSTCRDDMVQGLGMLAQAHKGHMTPYGQKATPPVRRP